MKISVVNRIIIIILLLWESCSNPVMGQQTNVKVTVSNKSFPERSDWGESVRISSIIFSVNKSFIGTLDGELNNPENSILEGEITCPSTTLELKIMVKYIHHTWKIVDRSYTKYKDYYIELTLDRYGSTPVITFTDFTGLAMVVNWSISFQADITPFQRNIENLSPQCYKKVSELKLAKADPVPVNFNSINYEWQCGLCTKEWVSNPEFTPFLNRICNNLSLACSSDGGNLMCTMINSAVVMTNYSSMRDNYDIYSSQNGYDIASRMLNLIISQNYTILPSAEMDFLTSNFYTAFFQESYFEPPDLQIDVVKEWKEIGISYNVDGVVGFNPSKFINSSISSITRVGIRVRAFNSSRTGPFSSIKILDVKPPAPTFSVKATSSCPDWASAVIELNSVSGNIPGMQYMYLVKKGNEPAGEFASFTGSSYQITTLYGPGDYKVFVEYDDDLLGGCSDTAKISIDELKDLKYNISVYSDATCPGQKDGSIKAEIVTYSGDYQFKLGTTVSGHAITYFNNLGAGKYIVEVTDGCHAAELNEKSIGEPQPVSITSVSKTDPTCLANPNGSLTINVQGGSRTYDYQVLNSSNSVIASAAGSESSSTFGSLPGGSYTIQASSKGCGWKTSSQYLAQVQPINFTTNVNNVDCYGQSTGKITVNASGGQLPYKFSINNQPYIEGNSFQSLSASTYLVSVHTNNMNCNDVKSANVTVTSAPKIEIGMTPVNATCFEKNDGLVTASVTGGSGMFYYSWEEYSSSGWFPRPGGASRLGNLYAGTYRVNVRDSKNCNESKISTVSEPPELVVQSAIPTDAVCFGDKGSIDLNASGGSGGNIYVCYNDAGNVFQSSFTRIAVPVGDYHYKVRDKNGCESDHPYEDVFVKGPDAPLVFKTVLKDYNGYNVPCNSDRKGEVIIEASGGNGVGYNGYTYSLSGSAQQQVNTFSALSAGSYSVKVTDGRGCTVQKSIQLTEPLAINLQLMHLEPVRCFGESTGEILVSASGGIVNTYNYNLNGAYMESSDVYKNLSVGPYNIKVTDVNGCTTDINTEIQSLHSPILASVTVQDVKCYGENSGQLKADVSGGSGIFSYEWQIKNNDAWQSVTGSNELLSNLYKGEYRLKITDSENCSQYRNAIIDQPTPLIISNIIAKDIACYGEKGKITVESQGGAGNYKYFFNREDGIKFQTTGPEYELPEGLYSISIKDANACEEIYPRKVAFTSPETPLGFTTVASSFNGYSVSCAGKEDGWVEVQATGGNGNGYTGYSYSMAGSADQPWNKFDDLKSGSYSIRVTDDRGCVIQKSLVLNEPDSLHLSLLYTEPVKCYGDATGKLAVNAIGGIEDTYKYRIEGGEINSTGLFTDLHALTYYVEVSDVNGCRSNLRTSIVNKSPQLKASLSSLPVICYGESTGSIQSVITGGAGGFTYKWEKKTDTEWEPYPGNVRDPVNLFSGYYRLTVEDADNCKTTSNAQVREPNPVVISGIRKKDAICYDDPGSILIEASGGMPEYKFFCATDNSVFVEYLPGSPLRAGSYKLKVTDSKGCTFENPEDVIITHPENPLDFTWELKDYNGFNVSCHGKNDGVITLHPSGGNGDDFSGYLFELSNTLMQTDNVFTAIEAGNYEMKLMDSRGCIISKSISLTEPPSDIFLTASDIRMPVCKYDSNGVVVLNATGGTVPYMYNVDRKEYSISNEFNNLPNGAYLFRVKDVNGCSETYNATLQNSVTEMQISGIISDSKCYAQNSGSIDVLVSGGAMPYAYKWKNLSSLTSHTEDLYKGDYTLNVTDQAGCKAERIFHVGEPDLPVRLSALPYSASVSQKNGSVKAMATGGTPPYRYAVDDMSNMNSKGFFDVYAGKHTVFVLDTNNCPAEIRVDVNERNKMPDVNFMLATSRYEADTLVVIDVSMPVPDRVIWQFSPEAVLIDSSSFKAKVKYDHAGVYPVTMTGVFGTCSYTIDKLLDIAPIDPLVTGNGDHYRGIKSIKISPNPNDSHFELKAELYTKQKLNIKIFDYYSRLLYNENLPADIIFTREISLRETLPGTYVLWVIAEDDARSAMLIISQ